MEAATDRSWVLIHSPLVGPVTWTELVLLLAAEARVFVPEVAEDDPGQPYWKQHCASVATQIDDASIPGPVLLVGHSGAGALVPSVAEICSVKVDGYVLVDAGFHKDGESRLDAIGYLRFTDGYESAARDAESYGWAVERTQGGHFEMLGNPVAVATALRRLAAAMETE